MNSFPDNKIQFNKLFPIPPFKRNVIEDTLNERTIEKQIGKLSAFTALIPLMPYDINIDYFSADNIKGNFSGSLKASTGKIQINVDVDASIFKEDIQLYLVYDFIECEVKIIDKLDSRYMVLWYLTIRDNKIDLGLSHNPYFNDTKMQTTLNEFRKELDIFFDEYNKAFTALTAKVDKVEKDFKDITDTLEYNDLSVYANRLQAVETVSTANATEIVKQTKRIDDNESNIENIQKTVYPWNHDFSNTLFIGDSFGTGWYDGHDSDPVNNWCVQLANNLKITNYRRYAIGGLCFTRTSANNLFNYIDTILNTEKNPESITSIIIMLGVNDSIISGVTSSQCYNDGLATLTKLKEKFINANIYFFYSAVRNIIEGKSYRPIATACTNTQIAFIGESLIWNNGASTDLYVKGTSSCYHPTEKGAKIIADEMANYFRIGDICPYHTTYISYEHTSDTTKPFDIHGGMFIKLENNQMHIDCQANIFRKGEWTTPYLVLSDVLPEEIKGNSDTYITVSTYDPNNHINGTFDINCGNNTSRISLDDSNNFLTSGVSFKINTTIDITSWSHI